ncbi:MAG: hypothetical protein CL763_00045 [Chloroflexi bacterium]|nr:hypothetical protein [Chloroflexota bacterium]|tara:strand:- start:6680 stop:8044 length:1365 start_codon:yes stop_codon:yes gene_type:complete
MLEPKTTNESRLRSSSNFLGILNDIKRRPEDAAKELDVSIELIQSIIDGSSDIPSSLIDKAIKIWPVNKRDFFVIEDDCPNGIKIMSAEDSEKSSRTMYRAEKAYYEYRDTAMSKVAPFRPEWILELCNVTDNDPENKSVQWNNGHFMHQFTYFIGNVNFYYRDKNGKKQTAVMNTGDSMYITPFVPHTFATRNNSQTNGLILALTYGGKLTGEHQQELSTMSNLGDNFALDFSSENLASGSLLKYHREISTLTHNELSTRTGLSIETLQNFESGFVKPQISDLEKISLALTVNIRDLLPNDKIEDKVIIKNHKDCKIWYYPENTQRYKFRELASTTALPFSKSFEVEILDSSNSELDLTSGLHQYIYNIGETPITLNWRINNEKNNKIINSNDSLYMKPFIPHNFRGIGKLLILRIGGKIPGDSQRELSIVGKDNAKRAISETTLWFDKKGKN